MDATHQVGTSSQLGCMEDELFASHLAARWTPPTRCKAVGGVDLQMGSSIPIPVGQDCRFMLQVREERRSSCEHMWAWACLHSLAFPGPQPTATRLALPAFLQVVGRLSAGRDLLPLLNAMKTDVNDVPQHRVKVARCGFTDAGKHSMQLAWVGATKDSRHLCSLERCVAEL